MSEDAKIAAEYSDNPLTRKRSPLLLPSGLSEWKHSVVLTVADCYGVPVAFDKRGIGSLQILFLESDPESVRAFRVRLIYATPMKYISVAAQTGSLGTPGIIWANCDQLNGTSVGLKKGTACYHGRHRYSNSKFLPLTVGYLV